MNNLPDDVDQLKAMLRQLQAENGSLKATLDTQNEEMVELNNRIQRLLEQLNLSQSKRFSAQSEQVLKGTFNEAEQQDALRQPAPAHHKKGRKPLPEELEREVHTHTLNAPHCECCGHELHQCGVETSEQLKIIPQQVSVIRHERAKYACSHCEHTDTRSKIVTAPKPPSMIPKSIGCPETFAAVVTAKYVDALPLYRQEAILTRSGIELSRTTLANWCVQLGSTVGVIVDEMKRHLLTEPVICADETTV
jgi:transposase